MERIMKNAVMFIKALEILKVSVYSTLAVWSATKRNVTGNINIEQYFKISKK